MSLNQLGRFQYIMYSVQVKTKNIMIEKTGRTSCLVGNFDFKNWINILNRIIS
jgi:hypothetical protein